MSTELLRENVAAAYETARVEVLVRIWNLGNAIAAGSYAQDIDREWVEEASR